jgi:hypothetical protein
MAFSSPIEATAVLASPDFGNRLVEVSDFTADTALEAGFAVYKRVGQPAVLSEVLHPDTVYLEAMEDIEARLRHRAGSGEELLTELLEAMLDSDDPEGGLPELNLGRIVTDEGFEGAVTSDSDAYDAASRPMQLRTDLAVVTHSHPLLHIRKRAPKTMLLPSSADLITYGDHMAASPGVMGATTVTHKDLGGIALFVWRARGPEVQGNLQTLPQGTNVTEKVIADLGLNTALITYNRHTGQPRTGLESVEGLWRP